MKIQESAENYLETIYMLSLEHPYVRSIDIATLTLGFEKESSLAISTERTVPLRFCKTKIVSK